MARTKVVAEVQTFVLFGSLSVSKLKIVSMGVDNIVDRDDFDAELLWRRISSSCHNKFGHVLDHDDKAPERSNASGLLSYYRPLSNNLSRDVDVRARGTWQCAAACAANDFPYCLAKNETV
jgi:hypothetical protein